MKTLLDREKEIKVLHAHNEAMEFYALEGAKKAGFPVRIAHAHNTHLPRGLKLPVKLVCKAMIPGAATDYFACGREAGIYYFGEKRWNESGVLIHNAIDLERFGYRSEVRTRLRRKYQLEDKLCGTVYGTEKSYPDAGTVCLSEKNRSKQPSAAGRRR